MRQDKERSIREQADLWKGYWCILACILLVGRVSYLTFFQNHIVSVYAAAQTEQKEDSSVQILQENLMEEIQIDDVQKMLDEIMDDHVFSVRKALMNIINGEDPVSKETVRSFLYSLFFSDIENEKGLILKLLLVIFIAGCWRSLLMFSETDRLAVSAFILSILRCLQCLWRISQGLEVRLQTGFLD